MTTAVAPPAAEVRPARDHRWLRFILRRTGRLVVSLWVLMTAAFLMVHLIPGDPVRAALGPTASAELVAARREALGLNDPLLVQYVNYFRGVFTGDFGTSIQTNVPVVDVIAQRLPATASLAVLAFLFALVISIPIGVAVAVATRRGRGRKLELGFASGSVFVSAIPDFLLGVALVAVFGVSLGWLPIAGRTGPESYILPVIALALGPAAVLARIVRVEMLGVLEADFVRTARAKRLPAWRIYLSHALPNAVTAALTLAGLLLGTLVVGTVLVENVFAWPGLGSTIVSSIQMKDYPVVQATVLVYGAGVLIINTVVDAILAVLDPRTTVAEH
ncbi:ABC transporter permease [Microbacterium sp. NPDC055910]|uniref:ABC transporter permease n=1 Tax=Microbacterium sp. NPDC055910 TaxID=3345659 RepID=UPI0035D69835